MLSKEIIIKSEMGLQARNASKFVEITNKFSSEIDILVDDKVIDGKSIMGILSLGICKNDSIEIRVAGRDEELLMEEISKLLDKSEY
jgi:phosphotransferase system HPr (HPr) family protein